MTRTAWKPEAENRTARNTDATTRLAETMKIAMQAMWKTTMRMRMKMLGTLTSKVNMITSVTELITGTNTDGKMGQQELIASTGIKGHEKELQLILKEFTTLFASDNSKLGCTKLVTHFINTENNGPIRLRPYRTPHSQK